VDFNAAEQVKPLKWDLRPHLDAHGVTPEPSRPAIDRAKEVMGEFADLDESTKTPEQVEEIIGEMCAALEELTQGSPTAAQFRQLYELPRVFGAFLNWLIGEIGPEGARSASTP
jgi:hypothetical protein